MERFRDQYKRRRFDFYDTRDLRTEQHEADRKRRRAQHFDLRRNIEVIPSPEPVKIYPQAPDLVKERQRQLEKFKERKDREKKLRQKQSSKRPAFKVGVVHHKVYSPVSTPGPSEPSKTGRICKSVQKPSPAKRITRATEKRLAAKAAAEAQKEQLAKRQKAVASKSKVKQESKEPVQSAQEEIRESFAPKNYEFTGPTTLQKNAPRPMFGRIPLPQFSLEDTPFLPKPSDEELRRSIERRKKELERQEAQGEESTEIVEDSIDASKDSDISANKTMILFKLESESPTAKTPNKENVVPQEESPKNATEAENVSIENPEVVESAMKTPPPVEECPAANSPYIVQSRGKSKARRESIARRGLSNSPEDIPTKENVAQQLNVSIDDEVKTARYFRHIYEKTSERLVDLCEKWDKEMERDDITETTKYIINQQIGQTRLLLKKKLQRFETFIVQCETGSGQMSVRSCDLQGFWDLCEQEVTNCEMRFENLEKLKENNWREEEEEAPVVKVVTRKTKAPLKRKAKAAGAASQPSKFKQFLQQQKQAKQSVSSTPPTSSPSVITLSSGSSAISTPASKRRNNSTPSIKSSGSKRSVASTPMSNKSSRISLLKEVQLSEASKRAQRDSKTLESPLVVMKISQQCKTPSIELDNSFVYVNSHQTPAKSILKSSSDTDSRGKSTHKVIFNETVQTTEVPADPESDNRRDLATALARIECMEVPSENPQKTLTFEDDSENEETEEELANDNEHLWVPTIHVSPASSRGSERLSSMNGSQRRQSRQSLDSTFTMETNDTESTVTSPMKRDVQSAGIEDPEENVKVARTSQRRSPKKNLESSMNQDSALDNEESASSTSKKAMEKSNTSGEFDGEASMIIDEENDSHPPKHKPSKKKSKKSKSKSAKALKSLNTQESILEDDEGVKEASTAAKKKKKKSKRADTSAAHDVAPVEEPNEPEQQETSSGKSPNKSMNATFEIMESDLSIHDETLAFNKSTKIPRSPPTSGRSTPLNASVSDNIAQVQGPPILKVFRTPRANQNQALTLPEIEDLEVIEKPTARTLSKRGRRGKTSNETQDLSAVEESMNSSKRVDKTQDEEQLETEGATKAGRRASKTARSKKSSKTKDSSQIEEQLEKSVAAPTTPRAGRSKRLNKTQELQAEDEEERQQQLRRSPRLLRSKRSTLVESTVLDGEQKSRSEVDSNRPKRLNRTLDLPGPSDQMEVEAPKARRSKKLNKTYDSAAVDKTMKEENLMKAPSTSRVPSKKLNKTYDSAAVEKTLKEENLMRASSTLRVPSKKLNKSQVSSEKEDSSLNVQQSPKPGRSSELKEADVEQQEDSSKITKPVTPKAVRRLKKTASKSTIQDSGSSLESLEDSAAGGEGNPKLGSILSSTFIDSTESNDSQNFVNTRTRSHKNESSFGEEREINKSKSKKALEKSSMESLVSNAETEMFASACDLSSSKSSLILTDKYNKRRSKSLNIEDEEKKESRRSLRKSETIDTCNLSGIDNENCDPMMKRRSLMKQHSMAVDDDDDDVFVSTECMAKSVAEASLLKTPHRSVLMTNMTPRKSARKSVRFADKEEECMGCKDPRRPSQPSTPHVRSFASRLNLSNFDTTQEDSANNSKLNLSVPASPASSKARKSTSRKG